MNQETPENEIELLLRQHQPPIPDDLRADVKDRILASHQRQRAIDDAKWVGLALSLLLTVSFASGYLFHSSHQRLKRFADSKIASPETVFSINRYLNTGAAEGRGQGSGDLKGKS